MCSSDLDAAALSLRKALELVRGAPFIGSGFGWADTEAMTSRCTLMVIEAALRLGELELSVLNVEGAFWASTIGLTVLPGHEELIGLRLRTHHAHGDVTGVRHEWQTYLRGLTSDSWKPEPASWLEDLYRRLTGESADRKSTRLNSSH